MEVINTCTVSWNDDGLLSIRRGCSIPASSLIMYVPLSNLTVITIKNTQIRVRAHK